MIHSDICGPMHTTSRNGYQYFVSFIDDYSQNATVYLLKNKSNVPDALRSFIKNSCFEGRIMRILRSDQGGEYTSKELSMILNDKGIMQSTMPSHSPELNGIAERFNHTIMTMV